MLDDELDVDDTGMVRPLLHERGCRASAQVGEGGLALSFCRTLMNL